MNYVYQENSQVVYPYTLSMLRRDNPNIGFPADPTPQDLFPFNIYPVQLVNPPKIDPRTQILTEGTPIHSDSGKWFQSWEVRSATPEEIATWDAFHLPPPDWDTFESIILQSSEMKNFIAFAATKNPLIACSFPAAFYEARRGNNASFKRVWEELVRIAPVEINVAESFMAVARACHLPKDIIQIVEDTLTQLTDGTLIGEKYPDWETFESLVLRSEEVENFVAVASAQNPLIAGAFSAAFFEAKNNKFSTFALVWSELTKIVTADPVVLFSIIGAAKSCDLPKDFIKILEA